MSKEKADIETNKYDLLSKLYSKNHDYGNRNADVIFVIRAFEYLEQKSGKIILEDALKTKYGQYKNAENIDYKDLCKRIENYNPNPDSAELTLLKEEITILCNYLETKKTSTSEHCLLEKCAKYRPFHIKGGGYKEGEKRIGGGRGAEEEFITQAFCYCLNPKIFPIFHEKIINLLSECYNRVNETPEHFPVLEGIIITPEQPDYNGNRMDISISSSTDNGENKIKIILENKVKAGFDPVQILRYCAHKDSPVVFAITYKNDCDEKGFKELIGSETKIREILEHHQKIKGKKFILDNIDRIKPCQWGGHLFWFWNKHNTKPSVHSIITETLKEISTNTIEYIYLSYFKSLIEAIKIKVVTLHEFKECLRDLNPDLPGLIDKINNDKELNWNITDYSIGETGPIFGLQLRNGKGCWPFKMEFDPKSKCAKIQIQPKQQLVELSRYINEEHPNAKIKELIIKEGGGEFRDSFGTSSNFDMKLLLKDKNYNNFTKVIQQLRNMNEQNK